MNKVLKIAVLSDLHCHSLANNSNYQESYILTDKNVPVFQDPALSLSHLIKKSPSQFMVDIVIMPGDLTNKACPEGLKKGYDIMTKIKTELNAKDILYNIGNHDIDSRKKYSPEPLTNLKNISIEYPFDNSDLNNLFWEKGYVIKEYEKYFLLLINTAHNHTEIDKVNHGDIDLDTVRIIDEALDNIDNEKVGIAVTHHCPIEHSHYNSGINDFMHNGDSLIRILDKYNFSVLIHGHKHDPRIRASQGGINAPFIFSAGSFSAFQDKLLLGGTNTFHILEINLDGKFKGYGKIKTWFFVMAEGWSNTIRNQYFNSETGFGAHFDLNDMRNKIIDKLKKSTNQMRQWDELVIDFPLLNYIMSEDGEKLRMLLKNSGVKSAPFIPNEPIVLQYKN
jgi:predicted MPP superfamily phosphohydrolase